MKCASCGHLNEPGHKFCGMCGARTERRRQERRGAEEGPRAVAMANAQLPTPDLPRARRSTEVLPREAAVASAASPLSTLRQRAHDQAPEPSHAQSHETRAFGSTIGGPSFLGLGAEPAPEGEYLLQDEKPSRGGLPKLVLLVVLMAIAGLIFVQWHSSYKAGPKAPEPPKPDPATVPRPQGKNQQPGAGLGGPQSAPSSPSGNPEPLTATGSNGNEERNNTAPAASGVPAAAQDLSPDPAKDPRMMDRATPDKRPEAQTTNQGALSPRNAKLEAVKDLKDADRKKPGKGEANENEAGDAPAARQKPSAALLRAQQYLQGRGVPRNCEQGMLYLKAATEENDPHADVQMAALYASGNCVRQDRVRAYRWFMSARDLQPANPWIEANMNQLWAAMTSGERHQAGK